MSTHIPEEAKDLLEGAVFITLSTVMPDGQPHSTIVWCTYDGEHIKVNTRRDSRKEKNMSARPMATVMAVDPQNWWRWIEVQGTVEEITEEGALDHINQLAQLYVGKSKYYGEVAPAEMADKETRIICKIKPNKAVFFNPQGG